MRWKLIIPVSLAAALIGAGAVIVLGLPNATGYKLTPTLTMAATLLIPIISIAAASIFVYRHTAKRRRLQAFTTGMLASLLTLTALFVGILLTGERRSHEEPIPTPAPQRQLG